ncbi:hypothetical protein C8Q76DRAFT_803952 [Earliella scabrosa]|nr:hypothetical protein C8Q76DRAFT_803952 [Earliella scabrosa]
MAGRSVRRASPRPRPPPLLFARRPHPALLSPHHLPPLHSRSPSPGPPPPPLSTSASAAPGKRSTEHVHRQLAFFGDMLQLSSAGLLAAAASSPASVFIRAAIGHHPSRPLCFLPARTLVRILLCPATLVTALTRLCPGRSPGSKQGTHVSIKVDAKSDG